MQKNIVRIGFTLDLVTQLAGELVPLMKLIDAFPQYDVYIIAEKMWHNEALTALKEKGISWRSDRLLVADTEAYGAMAIYWTMENRGIDMAFEDALRIR